MRVAKKIGQQHCPECRNGLVYADAWMAWLARRDDAEALWTGKLAFTTPVELLEELPDAEEEAECPACGGTGRVGHRQKHAA